MLARTASLAPVRVARSVGPRRDHATALRTKVALTAVGHEAQLAESAKGFDVHHAQIMSWKDQSLVGAAGVFSDALAVGSAPIR